MAQKKQKARKVEKGHLIIKFENPQARDHFARWLCDQGEQDYWTFMEYREEEEDGPITAINFSYHEDDGKFSGKVIGTECGRLK